MENKKRIFVYDFETTGLFTTGNQPIQVCAKVIEKDGKEINYNSYISYDRPLSITIEELTGITDAILAEKGRPIMDVMKEVAELVCKPDTLLVGHNIITFDNHFLNRYLLQLGRLKVEKTMCWDTYGCMKAELIKLERVPGESNGEYHARAISRNNQGFSCKLTDACRYYGIERKADFHNAIADVDYTYRIYLAQINKKANKPAIVIERIEEKQAEETQKKQTYSEFLETLLKKLRNNEITAHQMKTMMQEYHKNNRNPKPI